MIINIFIFPGLFIGCAENRINPEPLRSSKNEAPFTIPKRAENFRLLDHNGDSHELYYSTDKKAIVLISHELGCPVVKSNMKIINKLNKDFKNQGILFLMINADPQNDRFAIKQDAERLNIDIPILDDRAQIVSESLGITRTAEAVLITPHNWSIVYQGAIKKDLRDAIEALLKGHKIKIPKTSSKGRPINFSMRLPAQSLTYTKHIAPILQSKCHSCHSPGNIGPWSMDNYEIVKGWAPMIKEVIQTKRMPPYQPDPYYGKFKNDMSLTPKEIRMMIQWIKQGCPRGTGVDPLKTVPNPQTDDWPLGKPDIILSLNDEQSIPATGTLDYRYIPADKSIEKDIWIRATDMKPANPKTVHHALVLAQPAENASQSLHFSSAKIQTSEDDPPYISGHLPGRPAYFYADDLGRFIPKGTKIIFEMHYVTTGKPEKDKSQLGLYLHATRPSKELKHKFVQNKTFKIPPYAGEHKVSASELFENDILIYRLIPHMHYRGKYMKFFVQYPDGKKEIILNVPKYQFQWQFDYILETPFKLPAGSSIIVEGAFDNSPLNQDNPDPSKEIKFGRQSHAEMFIGVVIYSIEEVKYNQ